VRAKLVLADRSSVTTKRAQGSKRKQHVPLCLTPDAARPCNPVTSALQASTGRSGPPKPH